MTSEEQLQQFHADDVCLPWLIWVVLLMGRASVLHNAGTITHANPNQKKISTIE